MREVRSRLFWNQVFASNNARFWSVPEIKEDQVDTRGLYKEACFYNESFNSNKRDGFSIRCLKN